MPYQQNYADPSYYAQRAAPNKPNAAQYGGMQATGCGCGGAGYGAAPQGACTLAAPAMHKPPCHPAPLHQGCCGTCCDRHGCYQKIKVAYGY